MTTTTHEEFAALLTGLPQEQVQPLCYALAAKLISDFTSDLDAYEAISIELKNDWEAIQTTKSGTFQGVDIDLSAPELEAIFTQLEGASFADKTKLSPLLWMAVEFFSTDLLSALLSISIALPTKTDLAIQKLIAMLNLHTALKNAQVVEVIVITL